MGGGSVNFRTECWEGLLLKVLVHLAALVVGRMVAPTEHTADIVRFLFAWAVGRRVRTGALDAPRL